MHKQQSEKSCIVCSFEMTSDFVLLSKIFVRYKKGRTENFYKKKCPAAIKITRNL